MLAKPSKELVITSWQVVITSLSHSSALSSEITGIMEGENLLKSKL